MVKKDPSQYTVIVPKWILTKFAVDVLFSEFVIAQHKRGTPIRSCKLNDPEKIVQLITDRKVPKNYTFPYLQKIYISRIYEGECLSLHEDDVKRIMKNYSDQSGWEV